MLEEFLRRSALFDFYGALLTEKQQRCLSMSLFDDYSLSEIGEELGISRQAVHDMLHRSEQAMEEYESRLGLLARRDAERETLAKVYEGLKALQVNESEVPAEETEDLLNSDGGVDECVRRLEMIAETQKYRTKNNTDFPINFFTN